MTQATRYVRVLLTCWHCRHQRDADLGALIEGGRGDVSLMRLRCRCAVAAYPALLPGQRARPVAREPLAPPRLHPPQPAIRGVHSDPVVVAAGVKPEHRVEL
jgi:hypothetical protein